MKCETYPKLSGTITLCGGSASLFKDWGDVDLLLTNCYDRNVIADAIERGVPCIVHWIRGVVFPNKMQILGNLFEGQRPTGHFLCVYGLPRKDIKLDDLRAEDGGFWPVELPRRLLKEYGKAGDTILDPFMGRGTVGKACMELGMDFIGIDRDTRKVQKAYDYLLGENSE